MAASAPRSFVIPSEHCPTNRYNGGLLHLYVCDARALALSTFNPQRPEPLPSVVPLLHNLALLPLIHLVQSASLDWSIRNTEQGLIWEPIISYRLRTEDSTSIAWLLDLAGADLFILAVPPGQTLIWGISPMKLTVAQRKPGAEYSTDPVYEFEFVAAQQPAKAWYRLSPATTGGTPPPPPPDTHIDPDTTPSIGGFSLGFSPGFKRLL